jgi:hypothetical protein
VEAAEGPLTLGQPSSDSHPATPDDEWSARWMREFASAGLGYTDIKPALIWQAQLRLNERIVAAGLEPSATTIEVTWPMVAMLHDIFLGSWTAEAPPHLGPRDLWDQPLRAYRETFMTLVTTRRSIAQ